MWKNDAVKIMSALDCRSKYDPDNDIHNDPDYEPGCKDCKYYYDYGGCDLTQLLEDAANAMQELLRSKRCYTCKWRKNPDDCSHWLPCQTMKTENMWHCADWRDLSD